MGASSFFLLRDPSKVGGAGHDPRPTPPRARRAQREETSDQSEPAIDGPAGAVTVVQDSGGRSSLSFSGRPSELLAQPAAGRKPPPPADCRSHRRPADPTGHEDVHSEMPGGPGPGRGRRAVPKLGKAGTEPDRTGAWCHRISGFDWPLEIHWIA